MSTPTPVPTLAQAQQSATVVGLCNQNLATLNLQATNLQQQINSLQNYNPAADLVAAQAAMAGVQYAIGVVQQVQAAEQAIVAAYDAANPTSPQL